MRSMRLAAGDIPGPMRRSNRSFLAAFSSFQSRRLSSSARSAIAGASCVAASSSAFTLRTFSTRVRSSPYHRRAACPRKAVWMRVAASSMRRPSAASRSALVASALTKALPNSASRRLLSSGVSVARRSAEMSHIVLMNLSSAPVLSARWSALGAIATAGGRRVGRWWVTIAPGAPTSEVATMERPSSARAFAASRIARRDATDAGV